LFGAKACLLHEGNYVLTYIFCIENIIISVLLQCAVKVHRWRGRHKAQNKTGTIWKFNMGTSLLGKNSTRKVTSGKLRLGKI
jgi:hypothetical protein